MSSLRKIGVSKLSSFKGQIFGNTPDYLPVATFNGKLLAPVLISGAVD